MSELQPYSLDHVSRRIIQKFKPQDAVTLTASGGGTPSNTSATIKVQGASNIFLEAKHDYAESLSTNLDVLVYPSADGLDFSTSPIGALNLSGTGVLPLSITPGMHSVRVKVQNNDAVNGSKILTRLIVTHAS